MHSHLLLFHRQRFEIIDKPKTRNQTGNTVSTVKMATIPKKHRAMVYDKPGSVSTKLAEIDTPEPGAGEVLVKM